jgi:Leucine-rich repeat (LRR) protein
LYIRLFSIHKGDLFEEYCYFVYDRVTKNYAKYIITLIHVSILNRLDHSVCSVYDIKNKYEIAPEELKLNQTMSFIMDSQLNNLSINTTNLKLLEPSINRFMKLLILDLSRNQITKISGLILLPLLIKLDLSNNMILKIENLDQLKSLKSLQLYSNNIDYHENFIDNLVSLKKLRNFNMSGNPVRTEIYICIFIRTYTNMCELFMYMCV